MGEFTIAIDQKVGGILLATLLLTYFLKKMLVAPAPHLLFSNLTDLTPPRGRALFANFPQYCYLTALFCFAFGFIDPHLLIPKNLAPSSRLIPPSEGIAIYLVLDQSGSMSQNVTARDADGFTRSISKIALLKEVTKQFVESHPSDLLGLVAFARVPHILVPLTLDHQALLERLNLLNVVKNRNEDGTAMGYAIYKTAHLIAVTRYYAQELYQQEQSTYTIKNTIMIIVTDGLQDPSRLDWGNRLRTMELEEAAEYAKRQGIRIYIINIDPQFATETFAPHRRQMEKITRLTGGNFYLINDSQDLQKIYATISQIEKGPLPSPVATALILYKRISFYPIFILAGLVGLLCGFIFDFMILCKIP